MNGKEIGGKQIYVAPALKKADRVKELEHETLKYKNSKKRCNLYVKNFSEQTTEEDLKNLFQQYGEIESLKLFQQKDGKMPFAFVCYKTPDSASSCKNAQLQLNGKPLYINHYEMKKQRDLLNEANKDKQDWQRYQAENVAQFDFQNYDQISTLLRLLMHSVQNKNGQMPAMGNRSHSSGPMGGNPNYQGQGNFRGNNRDYNNRQGQGQHFNNQQRQMPRPGGMPQPMPQGMPQPMPSQGMPMPNNMPAASTPQIIPSNDTKSHDFYNKLMPIYAAITEINPNYKNQVGSNIFDFVNSIVGP